MTEHDLPGLPRIIEFLEREFRMQYREAAEMVQLPLAERVDDGAAIAGLRVVGYQTVDGRPATAFETDSIDSKLRPGDYFYCHPEDQVIDLRAAMQDFGRKQTHNKKILTMSANRRSIVLPGRFSRDVIWCVDQLPNERFPLTTYPCMMAGVVESDCEAGTKVQRWLSADVDPFTAGQCQRGPRMLTTTQRQALHRALNDEVVLIQGPPGTGKTFLIAEIIEQLLRDDATTRILVTCFSHTAIDNVIWAVNQRNAEIPTFRIGRRPEDPDLPPGIKDAGQQLHNFVSPGVWGMTAFKAAGPWTRALRSVYREIRAQHGDIVTQQDQIEMVRHAWAQSSLPSVNDYFDVTIIDEASQMTLPTALMALPHGSRCIFVGDEKQLPPVAQCEPSFAPSIFDHVIDRYEDGRSVMLDVTHRMNQEICVSPSKLFYGSELKPRKDIRERRLEYPNPPDVDLDRPNWLRRSLDPEESVLFLSTDHDTGEESSDEEAQVVARVVAEMLATGMSHQENLAVVCAHRKQNGLVRRRTNLAVEKFFPNREIDVDGLISDTVERIQGQERDVIIVSLTGSDPSHLSLQWTFSHCPRRFNVSITRPKSKLLVVGSPRFFHFTPDVGHGESLGKLTGIAALKRWYLDRLDRGQIAAVGPTE